MVIRNLLTNLEENQCGGITNDFGFIRDDESINRNEKLSPIQMAAFYFYNCGMNVIPVMQPSTLLRLAKKYPSKYNINDKRPYILKQLYNSRLHLCGDLCTEKYITTGKRCLSQMQKYEFFNLFADTNLGVVLGAISGNLVCVDNDSEESFECVMNEFNKRSLPNWTYKTSRGGHLLFRLAEGEAVSKSKSDIKDIEILGCRHFVVLPPSQHRSGIYYSWLDTNGKVIELPQTASVPVLSLEQVSWLGVKLYKSNHKHNCLSDYPGWVELLPTYIQEILFNPILQGTRNTLLTKVVYAIAKIINSGLVEYTDGLAVLEYKASKCLPPYDRMHVVQMLKSALSTTRVQTDEQQSIKALHSSHSQALLKAIYFMNEYDWKSPGHIQNTDMKVFEALILRAKRENRTPFRASVRELCLITNIRQPNTISRSLHRLERKGLIRRHIFQKYEAHHYSFSDLILMHEPHSTTHLLFNVSNMQQYKCNISNPTTSEEKDVFTRRNNAYLIWRHLQEQPEPTISQIARSVNKNRGTVHRELDWLTRKQLITFDEDKGLFLATNYDRNQLFDISWQRGTFGISEKQREKFKLDQEVWNNFLVASRKQYISFMIEDKRGA